MCEACIQHNCCACQAQMTHLMNKHDKLDQEEEASVVEAEVVH